ncbi:MAG: 3-isopropylmalate dehydratase [Fervidicoccaceae archaeon]
MRVRGWALVVGDNIDTDTIIPARHLHRADPSWLAEHVFEDAPMIRSALLSLHKPVIIIAGRGFGYGSSREQAVLALKAAGVGAVIARSFHRIFFRNALNNGLPALEALIEEAETGAEVSVDLSTGTIFIGPKEFRAKPLPQQLLRILEAGGIKEELRRMAQRMAKRA